MGAGDVLDDLIEELSALSTDSDRRKYVIVDKTKALLMRKSSLTVCVLDSVCVLDLPRRAKKERSKQRSHVRGILHYVERGDEVSETLHVGHETVAINGWRETVQLEAIRCVLASGLQGHLMACIYIYISF